MEEEKKEVIQTENDNPEFEEENQNKQDETSKSQGESEKKVQSAKVNSYFASKRRENEKKTYEDGIRETLKVNPYTGDEMVDDFDLQVYQEMKKLDEKGEDPIKGYAKLSAEKSRKRRLEEKEKQEQKNKMDKDLADFKKKYPDVDITEILKNDEDFKDYATGKLGFYPLASIYAGYIKLTTKYKPAADISTPSSQGKGEPKKKSISEMTDEEIQKEYEKHFPKNL